MKYSSSFACCLLLLAGVVSSPAARGSGLVPAGTDPNRATRLLGDLPLRFEPNAGQWNPRVQFGAKTPDYSLLLTGDGAAVAFPGSAGEIRIALPGARLAALEGMDPLPARANYFLGNRAGNWRSQAPQYGRVRYREIYPGIDLVYYGNNRQLEYDFVVRPGADPRSIRMNVRGAESLSLTPGGDLLIRRGGNQLLQKRPVAYQGKRQVSARYRLLAKNRVALALGDYDRSQPLTIDPVLVYASFVGGGGSDVVTSVKVDAQGMVYVTGYTRNSDITGTIGSYQNTPAHGTDVFVAKFNPALSGDNSLVFYTYVGGSGNDVPKAMALDGNGNVYVTGTTDSTDFPLAGNSVQTALSVNDSSGLTTTPTDAFVIKVAEEGRALYYSTYLGGTDSDEANGIDVDAAGNIYVVGTTLSGDFPLTGNNVQNGRWGKQDAFVVKIDQNSTALAYSSYLGGENREEGRSIAVTPSGMIYVAGITDSTQFPLGGRPLREQYQGGVDVFLAQLDVTKQGYDALVYSTYFGGSALDEVERIALDASGRLLLAGYTLSPDFPVSGNAAQGALAGNADAFVSVLQFSGNGADLAYSTFVGGNGGDVAYDIAAGKSGDIYITGYTLSPDFPGTDGGVQKDYGGGIDVFLAHLNPASGALDATYLGKSGLNVANSLGLGADGTIAVGGYTLGSELPITDNAYRAQYSGGGSDGFVAVIKPQ